jgi:glycerol uptake facilitator-like aquaporin
MTQILRSALATFLLVVIGTGVATQSGFQNAVFGGISVAIAFGIALFVAVIAGGPNGQVNPAETVGKCLSRQQPWTKLPLILAGQLAGAALGSLLVEVAFFGPDTQTNLGAATPGPTVNWLLVLLVEGGGTYFLIASGKWAEQWDTTYREASPFTKAAIAGAVLAGEIFFALQVTGGAFNPARWFGPALLSGTYTYWLAYLVGQFVGGALATVDYPSGLFKRRPKKTPVAPV